MREEKSAPPAALRWSELSPDEELTAALDHAGERPTAGQDEKRRWSESFANRCAVAFATTLNRTALSGKIIRPLSMLQGTEPLTPLGIGTSKRIDVTVVDAILGLEIGISLKGLNFRDGKSNNYDKNLTGRLYEMGDEMRLVHEHLPHAFMAGIFWLPLEATVDKSERAESSFAHAVRKLRERTGRLDVALSAHAARCDAGFVGLYVSEGRHRGVARLFDVTSSPPGRGRPMVSATLSISETADEIVRRATYRETITWGEAESDD